MLKVIHRILGRQMLSAPFYLSLRYPSSFQKGSGDSKRKEKEEEEEKRDISEMNLLEMYHDQTPMDERIRGFMKKVEESHKKASTMPPTFTMTKKELYYRKRQLNQANGLPIQTLGLHLLPFLVTRHTLGSVEPIQGLEMRLTDYQQTLRINLENYSVYDQKLSDVQQAILVMQDSYLSSLKDYTNTNTPIMTRFLLMKLINNGKTRQVKSILRSGILDIGQCEFRITEAKEIIKRVHTVKDQEYLLDLLPYMAQLQVDIDAEMSNIHLTQALLSEQLIFQDKPETFSWKQFTDMLFQSAFHPQEMKELRLNRLRILWMLYRMNVKQEQVLIEIEKELNLISFEGTSQKQAQSSLTLAYARNRKSTINLLKKLLCNTKDVNELIVTWALTGLILIRANEKEHKDLSELFLLFKLNVGLHEFILYDCVPEIMKNSSQSHQVNYLIQYRKWKTDEVVHPILKTSCKVIFQIFLQKKAARQIIIRYDGHGLLTNPSVLRIRRSGGERAWDSLYMDEIQMVEHLSAGRYDEVWSYANTNSAFFLDPLIKERKELAEAKLCSHKYASPAARGMHLLSEFQKVTFQFYPPAMLEQENYSFDKVAEKGEIENVQFNFQNRHIKSDRNQREKPRSFQSQRPNLFQGQENLISKDSQNSGKKQGLLSNTNKSMFNKDPSKQAPFFKNNKYSFSSSDGKSISETVEKLKTEVHSHDVRNLLRDPQGLSIVKYLFLFSHQAPSSQISERKLQLDYTLSSGSVSKSYDKYIADCHFNFPLPPQVYISLLEDQLKVYNRAHFKRIISHMIIYSPDITDESVTLFCSICFKQQIAFTLIDIMELVKSNRIPISPSALKEFTKCWQRFDSINDDLLNFTKSYCKQNSLPLEIELFEDYCRNLTKEMKFDKLNLFVQSFLAEVKQKSYKLNQALKTSENLKLEKEFRAKENERFAKIMLSVLKVVVLSVHRKVPPFLVELFTEYNTLKTTYTGQELALSAIAFSADLTKIELIIKDLKENPQKVDLFVYQCLLKAIDLNTIELKPKADEIFECTMFKARLVLNEAQVTLTLQIFRRLDNSTLFTKVLEHFLRFQTNLGGKIKNDLYNIMNDSDDQAKGSIFTMLQLMFSPKKEKQRNQYRRVKIAEEEKAKRLAEISGTKTVSKQKDTFDQIQLEGKKKKKEKKGKKQKKDSKDDIQEDGKQAEKRSEKESKISSKSEEEQKQGKDGAPSESEKKNSKSKAEKSDKKTMKDEAQEQGQEQEQEQEKKEQVKQKSKNQLRRQQKKKEQIRADRKLKKQKLKGEADAFDVSQDIYTPQLNSTALSVRPELSMKQSRRQSLNVFIDAWFPAEDDDLDEDDEEEAPVQKRKAGSNR